MAETGLSTHPPLTLSSYRSRNHSAVELLGFNTLYNDAIVRFHGTDASVEAMLHTRRGWLPTDGPVTRLRGALMLPPDLVRSTDPLLARLALRVLRGQNIVDLSMVLHGPDLHVRERGLFTWPGGFTLRFAGA